MAIWGDKLSQRAIIAVLIYFALLFAITIPAAILCF